MKEFRFAATLRRLGNLGYSHCKGRVNTSELGLFNTQRYIKTLEIDTLLNDETSEIERYLCAFGSIG